MNEEHLTEGLYYGVVVTDKHGQKLFDERGISHSYTEVWNKLINIHARQTEFAVKDINGVIYSIKPSSQNLAANAGIGEMRWGIMIGKGNTPVDISNYSLVDRIHHGTGLEQLSYQETVFTEPVEAAPNCSFTMRRSMINDSGNTIRDIQEMGCYVWLFHSLTEPPNYISALAIRDVIPRPAFIYDGGAITITYT
ncbi:MAG: hypothetical protein JW712_14625, partial [Dehalococcoidales bacterium]|nr:hypothetical protein [Dehalococcoidales bacterium]